MGREINILAIDEDPLTLDLLAALLADMGRVRTCADAIKGAQLALKGAGDLVICATEMAQMNGLEICRQMRKGPLTREIPLLCLSAGSGDEQELAALSAGAVDFIKKPIHPLILRARVKTQIELLKKTAQLLDVSRRDPLTGMFNRRYFDERAAEEWDRLAKAKAPMALAMMDVDHFKALNDWGGHARGDQCLLSVADCSRQAAWGPGQLAARYGGEEFVFMLPGLAREQAAKFGEDLRAAVKALGLEHPHSPSGMVTASVGVAWAVAGLGEDPSELLRLADKALYQAKKSGRDRSAFIARGATQMPDGAMASRPGR